MSESKQIAAHTCSHIGVAGTTRAFVMEHKGGRCPDCRGSGKGWTPELLNEAPCTLCAGTKVYVGFEARIGIALFGASNMNSKQWEKLGDNPNPFEEQFHDNFARGFGPTEIEALEALKADMHKTAEGLWE